MVRTLRALVAAGSVAALMMVAAPAAQAGPEDAAGCTTDYVDSLSTFVVSLFEQQAPELVEYTPPADVDVNGNIVVGYGTYVGNATFQYVDCIR